MTEDNNEDNIMKIDTMAELIRAEEEIKRLTYKLLDDGYHWGPVAAAMSNVLIDWVYDHSPREDFEKNARRFIATQRYTARRLVREIINTRGHREAVSFFDLLEKNGHGYGEA